MACGPFGCGGDPGRKLETCGVLLVLVAGTMIAGELWFEGHRLASGAAAGAAGALLFGGPMLVSCLDAVGLRVFGAARAGARLFRRAGRLYCPECSGELRAPEAAGLPARAECPECRGAWCGSEELAAWLQPGEAGERTWISHPPEEGALPPACPRCAATLERGNWTGFPTFVRCAPCDGLWVPRLARARLELDRPRASRG